MKEKIDAGRYNIANELDALSNTITDINVNVENLLPLVVDFLIDLKAKLAKDVKKGKQAEKLLSAIESKRIKNKVN